MDQRSADRYELSVPVRITGIEGEQPEILNTRAKNISSKGAYIALEPALPEGKHVRIELLLPVSRLLQIIGEQKKVMIRVDGTVVRSEAEGMAIHFEKEYEITALETHES